MELQSFSWQSLELEQLLVVNPGGRAAEFPVPQGAGNNGTLKASLCANPETKQLLPHLPWAAKKSTCRDEQSVSGALGAPREIPALLGALVLLRQLKIILGLAAE